MHYFLVTAFDNSIMFQEQFKASLLEQAELSRREATTLLDQFLAYGPFSSEWSAKDGLKYVAEMKEKLNAMIARDEQLNNDLSVFGLSFPESLAVARLESVRLITFIKVHLFQRIFHCRN